MCGIVGYIGNNAVTDVLLEGLKNLEYRGYDSSGIALNDNHTIGVYKASGKLGNLYQLCAKHQPQMASAHQGIGHIRWATHGKATIENAHPHISNDGKLVLVHNGIIENYKELRKELENEGFVFHSETDTETAVHIIDREYKLCHNLETSVIRAIPQIKGAFAFCIMHADEADKIIAVRKNAPLIIGIGKDENFIASDIPALIGKTNQILHLNDEEIAIVHKSHVEVKDTKGNTLNKTIEKIEFSPEVISKAGYKHFMLKEINEQPAILRKILQKHLPKAEDRVALADSKLNIDLSQVRNITFVACGTSLHAAYIAKATWEKWLNIPVEVVAASEFIYRYNLTNEHSLVIGISQSGETADTMTAIKQAKENKAQLIILTNRTDSSITRYSSNIVALEAGIEVSVAATKSFMAQLAALYWTGMYLSEQKDNQNKFLDLKRELYAIPALLEEILSELTDIKRIGEKLSEFKQIFYIARGIMLPIAMEGALKIKEISYINANAYASGELKHGPIALLDKNTAVVPVLAQGAVYEKTLSNCEEAKARQAQIFALSNNFKDKKTELFNEAIIIPEVTEDLSPLLMSLPLQLLAYFAANKLDREIDQPRNLAKSVTVE